MYKTIISFILSLLIISESNTQDYILPKFGEHIERIYWDSENDNEQVEYWKNGNIKVRYQTIEDNKKWRFNYSENGKLKFKVQVHQEFTIDTIMVFDYDTYDETYKIKKGIRDTPNGPYKAYKYYYNSDKPVLQESGQYKNGLKTGIWWKDDVGINKLNQIKANFKEGELSGLCTVYHRTITGLKQRIKYEGNYGIVEVNIAEWNVMTREFESVKTLRTKRIGTWIYYNELEQIIEKVEYQH